MQPWHPSQFPEQAVVQPKQVEVQSPQDVLQDAEHVSLHVFEHVFAQVVEQLEAHPDEQVVQVAACAVIPQVSLAAVNATTDATTATASTPRLIRLVVVLFSYRTSLFSMCSM